MRVSSCIKIAKILKTVTSWMAVFSIIAFYLKSMKATIPVIIGVAIGYILLCLIYLFFTTKNTENEYNFDPLMHPFFFAAPALALIISASDSKALYSFMVGYVGIFLILYLWNFYISGLVNSTSGLNNNEAGVFLRQSKNHTLILAKASIFIFIVFALITVLPSLSLEKIIKSIIGFIFKTNDNPEAPSSSAEPIPLEEITPTPPLEEMPVGEGSDLAIVLFVAVIIIAAAIFFLYLTLKNINQKLNMKFSISADDKYIYSDIEKTAVIPKSEEENSFFASPRKKVRRTFIKTGISVNPTGRLRAKSPREILPVYAKDSKELIDVYEKARYSTEEITNDDAKAAKGYSKTVKKEYNDKKKE